LAASGGKLTAIQKRVLEALATVEPPFVLSGGAALAGVYLAHRTTRDLDLFWRNRDALEGLSDVVSANISTAGLAVETLHTSPAFVQLRATDQHNAVVIDLVAEAADNLDPPLRQRIGDAEILVDSPRAILAEKLCALLERSELRDLIDIEALIRNGESLQIAIDDAPRRDSGFSPLTLAWVLRTLDVKGIAPSAGIDPAAVQHLDDFRRWLIDQLVAP